jgi:hypothetical protein
MNIRSSTGGNGATAAPAPDIIRADPRLRRLALLMVLGTAVLGGAAIEWLLPWANATVEEAVRGGMPRSVVCKSTLGVLSGFALMVAAFGVHTARVGRRVALAAEFPLPGTRVIRDTPVLRGRTAVLLGRSQTFLGNALVVLAAALLALTAYGLAALMR